MSPVIKIENLSKKYIINHDAQESFTTLVETLSNQLRVCKRKLAGMLRGEFNAMRPPQEPYWALNDVSLDIEEGDRVGIIGRNGAGKSTLLKIISRITPPTSGKITMRGRVSSLLEVGTGFHHELSGRENIFLNGSILGMRHREIKRRFDEIVEFSGIGKFLDTPVKRYSSGMFARLGFAIAAHLHSDILIIDEVLAVGDAQFQKKCLSKLDELGKNGRTVLFVSHSIGSVLSLCNKGVYLDRGQVKKVGAIQECADAYSEDTEKRGSVWDDGYGDRTMYFHRVAIEPPSEGKNYFVRGDKASVVFDVDLLENEPNLYLGIKLFDSRNQFIGQSFIHDERGTDPFMKKPGRYQIQYPLDTSNLYEGEYFVKVECGVLHDRHIVHDTLSLQLTVVEEERSDRFSESLSKGTIYLGQGWDIR